VSHPGSGQSLRWEEAPRGDVRSTPAPNRVRGQPKPSGIRTKDLLIFTTHTFLRTLEDTLGSGMG
jgi:hypothetical protein